MALQNLDISDTLLSIGNFVKNDAAVQEFCDSHFDNELKVFVGDFARKNIPVAADCPYIVFTDFRKKRGRTLSSVTTTLRLSLAYRLMTLLMLT